MRKITLFLVQMLITTLAFAQVRTVTGKITDKKGDPVPGSSVTIKGKAGGAAADANGEFNVKAKPGDVLVITSLGYGAYEIKAGNQTYYSVVLSNSDASLDEVVVTTAGGIKTKKKEIGTATTVIKSEVLTAGKAVNAAAGLQGKVAGFQISGTGGGVNPSYRLVLRGQRSLTGNNQALVVLDNVIVPNTVLGNLNPEDMEEIVILNGSGAAALYGSQASNGAIIVTSKKGKKGITTINIANTVTVESVAFFPKIQKKFGPGGTAYGLDANGNPMFNYLENQSYGPAFDGSLRPLGPALQDGSQDSATYSYKGGHDKFWQKGVTNQTDFSLSNGDANSTFYLSGQYATVTGTTPGDKYNRTTLRVNGTRKIGNMVNVVYSSAYTQNRYDISSATGTIYSQMLNMPSNVDITKYKNWRTDKFANPNGFYNPWYNNPYFTADNNREKDRNDYLTANLEVRFSPVKGLDFVARQGIATKNATSKSWTGAFTYTDFAKHTDQSSKADITATVNEYSGYTTALLSDLFLQFNKKISVWDFNLIAGGQWTQNEAKYQTISASGLVVPDLYNVSNGVGTPGVGESDYKTHQIGAYADLRIGYKGYLFLHGTGRNDWVSILDPAHQSFFYPSVDLSFVVSDAVNFIKQSQTISFLKLRAGLSKVGQVNLGNGSATTPDYGAYYLLPTFSSTNNGFPYGSLAGYSVGNRLVAKNLKPEVTRGYEVGFDLNLFKDRFVSTVTWYSTKTDDQTVPTSISTTTGFSSLLTNAGQTQSQGLEVSAHVTPLKSHNWSVTVGGNYTYLDNKVNYISAALPSLGLSTEGTASSVAMAGQPFSVIRGNDYIRDAAGHVIVDATTGLPTKNSTLSVLGNTSAKDRIGLDASVTFKTFHFSVLFEYRGGYKIYNGIGPELDWAGTGYRTAVYNRQSFIFPNSVYEDPSKPGTYIKNTSVSIANGNGNNGFWTDDVNRGVSSNYVTSGNFWKLREIALSYDIPSSLLAKTKSIKGITLSVQARNLFVWLAKDNIYTDPEYSSAGNDNNGVGLNNLNQTPPSRFYGGTISFKF